MDRLLDNTVHMNDKDSSFDGLALRERGWKAARAKIIENTTEKKKLMFPSRFKLDLCFS